LRRDRRIAFSRRDARGCFVRSLASKPRAKSATDRRWRGRRRLLISAACLRGAFQEEVRKALVMSSRPIKADQVSCWGAISDARWPLHFNTPSAVNLISSSVGMP
jgi:hypothetical protein